MPTKIAIHGAAGRMGRRLLVLACADIEMEVVQAIEYEGHPHLGKAVRELEADASSAVKLDAEIKAGAEVLIDFTTPEATAAAAGKAAARGLALVIGTTALAEEQLARVSAAASQVAVIHAPNYSLGVNVLLRLVGEMAQAIGGDFNIEIVESHHNLKEDAPSGTAMALAERICAATGRNAEKDLVYGRQGRPGARTKHEIGMHALRLGAVVGTHTVHFGGEYELIELTHRAQNRDVFAFGALRAAKWIAGRKPGMYTMAEVLFG